MAENWSSSVNKKVLRDGASWSSVQGFIENESLSGKTVRRLAHSMGKRKFSVKMRFTISEYNSFIDWYNNTIFYGSQSFMFPQIDAINGDDKEYRFANGGEPKFSNPSGKIIECDMEWEEV